jgi:hypothetical protein
MSDKQSGNKANRDARGYYLPGHCHAGPGRPKGSRNAITMTIKDCLEESFLQLGGVDWLVALGRNEPKAFAQLLGKLLPPAAQEAADEMTIHIIGGFTNEDRPDDE